MEKIDILVKGVPVPMHNMFKGLCSVAGKSISEGVIESMGDWIRKNAGGITAEEPAGGARGAGGAGRQGKKR